MSDTIVLNKIKEHPESFFAITKPALRLAQFFALFPCITGLNGPTHRNLHIQWTWKSMYALYASSVNFLILACMLEPAIYHSLHYDSISGAYFYLACLLSFINMGRLSRFWVRLCKEFSAMESLFLRHGYPNLRLKFKLLLIGFMFSAAVEHFLAIVQSLVRTLPCVEKPGNVYSTLDAFFINNYIKVFRVIGYRFWMGFALFHLNIVYTFWWNFLDLLLSFLAIVLCARLEQFNGFLSLHSSQVRNKIFWRQARLEFNSLARLTKSVSKSIGELVVLSFLSNIIVLCTQLLRSLHTRTNAFQIFYFAWSFGFLLFRSILSSFYMAEVHNRSKQCKHVLYSIPSNIYCREAERLFLQVENDKIAITGCGLFTVTRSVLLTIVGTVVTYEVVLLQFNTVVGFDNWPTASNRTFCSNKFHTDD